MSSLLQPPGLYLLSRSPCLHNWQISGGPECLNGILIQLAVTVGLLPRTYAADRRRPVVASHNAALHMVLQPSECTQISAPLK